MKRNRQRAAGNKHTSHRKSKRSVKTEITPIIPPTQLEFISKRKLWLTVIALFVVSLTINSIGLNWGQPSGYSWNPDSIAGSRTLYRIPRLFKDWNSKYPKGHFLTMSVFYKPFADHWKKDPVQVTGRDGKQVLTAVNDQRMSTLIMVSRTVSAVMGACVVIMVFLTGRLLFNDYLAGVLAALAIAFMQLFVFYNHLGNLDTPSIFWFAFAVYWGVKIVYIGKWRHYILFGFCCAYAVCIKDAAAGFFFGLVFAMWIAVLGRGLNELQMPFKKAAMLLLNRRTLVSLAVAIFVFALLNDLLTSPSSFTRRMSHWVGGAGVEDYNKGFKNHWWLMKVTYGGFYYSLGWPMLYGTIASLGYCLIRYRWKVAFGILPLISFYFIIVYRIEMSMHRYFIPAFACLALLVGKSSADLIRIKKIPIAITILPVAFVYVLSLMYCIGLGLDMAYDSRHLAEKWLKDRVAPNTVVGGIAPRQYVPRLDDLGCRVFYAGYAKKNQDLLNKISPYTDYLVLGEKEFKCSRFDKAFLKKLLAGELGYTKVASFENRFLYPKKTILGIAGRPKSRYSMLSPEIIILKKNKPQPPSVDKPDL